MAIFFSKYPNKPNFSKLPTLRSSQIFVKTFSKQVNKILHAKSSFFSEKIFITFVAYLVVIEGTHSPLFHYRCLKYEYKADHRGNC